MTENNNDNRVLNRRGARPLSNNELDEIAGGVLFSVASRLITGSVASPDFELDT